MDAMLEQKIINQALEGRLSALSSAYAETLQTNLYLSQTVRKKIRNLKRAKALANKRADKLEIENSRLRKRMKRIYALSNPVVNEAEDTKCPTHIRFS